MNLEIYTYSKNKKKFSNLLALLKNYKDFDDDSLFHDYYELNKTPKTINIQRVNNFGNIILPTVVSIFLALITLGTLILLVSDFNFEKLFILIISFLFTLAWISVPYREVFGSHELHYFTVVEKVYISNKNEEIPFDEIYGFFVEYTIVDTSIDGPANTNCYKLNMILNNEKIIHLIAELNDKEHLLEDAKTIARYTQKPLYYFDTDRRVYFYLLKDKLS